MRKAYTSKRWLGVHLPQLHLDSLIRASPQSPWVVYIGAYVHSSCEAMHNLGLNPGSSIHHAKALAPHAHFVPHDNDIAQRLLMQIARNLHQFSSEIILIDQQCLLIELGRSRLLFGGFTKLFELISTQLKKQGHLHRLAMGPHAYASDLLAKHYPIQALCIDDKTYHRWLATLPLNTVINDKALQQLNAAGVHYVGQWLDLPKKDLSRRFDLSLQKRQSQLQGKDNNLPCAIGFDEDFQERVSLNQAIDNVQELDFIILRLASKLQRFLSARAYALERFELSLSHGNEVPESLLQFSLAEASNDQTLIYRLISQRLDDTRLQAPVEAVSLRAHQFNPAQVRNQCLFLDQQSTAPPLPSLLDQLRSRLGPNAVLWLEPLADHRPECAYRLNKTAYSGNNISTKLHTLRPLGFYSEAQILHRLTNATVHINNIEFIESGWWQQDIKRRYGIAYCDRGCRLWVYQDRQQTWLVQGVFD